ncbi:MAG: hypothetical protein KME67_05130 [Candidatus Thiodiazotropha sp. (ex Codakia orbicularis)]|nr:hypothetical protein [Candidatus Thiodiazotropha sp. (ex Codakia orbicularis)]
MDTKLIKDLPLLFRAAVYAFRNSDWRVRSALLMPIVLILLFAVLPELGLSDNTTRVFAIAVMWVMIGPWLFSRLG